MADLPRGFSIPKSIVDKPGASDDKARLESKKDGKRPMIPQDHKKRGAEAAVDQANKKLKLGGAPKAVSTPTKLSKDLAASTIISNFFGPIAAPYVGENLIHKWQSPPTEEQELAAIQAAAQLVVQTIERAQRGQEGRAALAKLKAENNKLNEMIVESDNKWKKDLDAARADLDAARADVRFLRSELKEASEHNEHFCKSIDQLKAEKEDMQVKIDSFEIERSEWGKERDSINKGSFVNGFNCYLINFLAQDPNYDWTKFGPGCVEDIAAFKIKRADDIKARRVELGLEKTEGGVSSSGEVPPSDKVTDQIPTPADPDRDVSYAPVIPPQDASPSGAP